MQPNVIIVGGGYGGLRTAAALNGHARVTVIDRNDYFHHKSAALRGMLFDGWADRIYVDFKTLGMDCEFVQGTVERVDRAARSVTLHGGETLSFDYLVLATGSTTSLATETLGAVGAEARRKLVGLKSEFANANRVVIVGDGPVGVEMAGEYRDLSPNIEVTIVSSADVPMATIGHATFSERVADLLKRHRVQRIAAQRVTEISKNHVTLENGKRLDADIVVDATGIKPNTDWIMPFAPQWLDQSQHVQVGEDLAVIGETRIFALGDCSNIAEPKMVKMADDQGKYLGAAIVARIKSETPEPYKRFSKKLTILPFGAKDGVALLPIGQEGKVVWRPLGRFLVIKRKGTQLMSNMFPSLYAAAR